MWFTSRPLETASQDVLGYGQGRNTEAISSLANDSCSSCCAQGGTSQFLQFARRRSVSRPRKLICRRNGNVVANDGELAMARLRALLALLLSAWAASLGCGSSDGGPNDGGSGSPDGTWSVEVAISSCYSFTGTGVITVSGGSFSGRLFGYCAVATNGATRLEPSSGCAGDETEEVTIDGTFSAGQVSGNLTLTGGACNGGNGFEGFLSSSSAATAGDAWGTLTFTKESNSGSDGGPVAFAQINDITN